ncbi:nuclear factor 7, brain-like [Hemitrygon akajei]|uniref:nuclear factor 7, brain-like n=1 Tax=Hemitrygon akajei TaxID=2704970 RepID=UPI003BF9DCA7
MASKGQAESWTEETICPVCLDFFTDPVILECGHNFCRSCITRCWEREQRHSCPECRAVFADRNLKVNRALANLAEKARNLNLNPKEKESKRHCEEHEEELKLFCETDKTLICLICRDAQEHRRHRFKPIKEAVKICKDQLKSSLDSLTKKKSDFQEKEQQQKEKISGVRKQSHSLQSYITSQFAELRQIITEKEQSLLRDLREEEKRILNPMEKNLLKIQENIRIIQEEISELKEQIDQKDGVIFLKGFTSGRHYWEVEVPGIRFWFLGVAAESVEREGGFSPSPETGFWIIGRVGDVAELVDDVTELNDDVAEQGDDVTQQDDDMIIPLLFRSIAMAEISKSLLLVSPASAPTRTGVILLRASVGLFR